MDEKGHNVHLSDRGLDRLVQAVAPTPARHLTTRELVDDHDLAVVSDDVLLVLLE